MGLALLKADLKPVRPEGATVAHYCEFHAAGFPFRYPCASLALERTRTHWATLANFQSTISFPMLRACHGASNPLLGRLLLNASSSATSKVEEPEPELPLGEVLKLLLH
jgi:hypothetical protein